MNRYVLRLLQKEQQGIYYIFTFAKPVELQFHNGQYGVFLHVDKEMEGRKMRAFSFASSTHDDHLTIATFIPEEPSHFKKWMIALEPGDAMTVDGPMGTFTWDYSVPAVFIAGGIGITPIASILSEPLQNKATLIYTARNSNYLFTDNFNKDDLTTFYENGRETAINRIEEIAKAQPNSLYYVVGSSSFVTAVSTQLEELGIQPEYIKKDRFTGY